MTRVAQSFQSSGATRLQTRLAVIGAGAGLLVLTLPLKWFSADSPYGSVDASGWEALTIGRIVLLLVVVAAGAFAFEGLRGRLGSQGISVSDAAHVVAMLAGIGAAWILLRTLIPPHFAEVVSGYSSGGVGFGSSQDETATAAISYSRTAAVFLALAGSVAVCVAAYLVARDEPSGFDSRRALQLVAAARHGWPGVRVAASARPACRRCGARVGHDDRFCTSCGAPREAS